MSLPRSTTPVHILSGRFKGQKLLSAGDAGTHPMGSREKLALFNMIDVRGCHVLDAFAGTGALGCEAISRGAKSVVFVEKSPINCRFIRQNCQKLGLDCQIFTEKVLKFASRSDFKGVFDVIFADPPYDGFEKPQASSRASYELVLAEIQALSPFLAVGGHFVLSSPAKLPVFDLPGLSLISSRTYAAARLSIYRKIAPN